MNAAVTPVDRVTAVLDESRAVLRCSHCEAEVTDDDPECPRCDSPIDWGASDAALRAWHEVGGR
jgi:Zn finger protein HypA/HybF involved in hydrogenase expression